MTSTTHHLATFSGYVVVQRTLFSLMTVQSLQALAQKQNNQEAWRTFVDKLYALLRESTNVDRGIFCRAKKYPDVDPSDRNLVWLNAQALRSRLYCGRGLLYVPERLQKERNEKGIQQPRSRDRCLSDSEMNSWEWFPMQD